MYGAFFYQKASHHTCCKNYTSHNHINNRPTVCFVQVKAHKSAEYHQYGYQWHHGINPLNPASVRLIPFIRQPCIVSSIIGSRTKEGHHTVQNNYKMDSQGRCLQSIAADRCQDIHTHQSESQNRYSPHDISATDKELTLSHPIRQRSYQNRRQGCCHRTCANHHRDICRRSMKHFVNKYIQIHIFHNPSHLPDQPKQYHGNPKSVSQLFHLFFHSPHHPVLSFSLHHVNMRTFCIPFLIQIP